MMKVQSQLESIHHDTGLGCRQKVFILTGDENLRSMLKYPLEYYDMQVLFPQGGTEALAFSTIEPFDCIIIDCDMLCMDDSDHIRRLREQFEFAIIIGLCKEDKGVTYLQAGMNDFFQKPFSPYRLAMMLDGGDIPAWHDHGIYKRSKRFSKMLDGGDILA